MIDPPFITQMPAQEVAYIPITIPRNQIQSVMMPGLNEIRGAVKDQGIEPAGPWFTHHHFLRPDEFVFDICVPVSKRVKPQGRVQPLTLQPRKVARTVYRGNFDQLGQAWKSFMGWISSEHLSPCIDFFECYAKGPDSGPDPSLWETVLSVPLMD